MNDFEKSEATLKSRFKNKTELKDFIETEMTINLFMEFSQNGDVLKAYKLLHSYHIIGDKSCSDKFYYLQKAHQRLSLRKAKLTWQESLLEYMKPVYDDIRMFNLEEKDEKIFIEEIYENIIFPNRQSVYKNEILEFEENPSKPNYAKAGKYEVSFDYSKTSVIVNIDNLIDVEKRNEENHIRSEKIEIEYADLLNSAQKMESINKADYCYDVLKKNKLMSINGTKNFTIENITNIVGAVGAGKSTFIKALSYHLSNQDKKIVIVLDSVTEVMKFYDFFYKLNIKCSPLIGKSDREKYIRQVIEKEAMYLQNHIGKYMTGKCFLSGLNPSIETVCEYGDEPCFNLKKSKSKYVCPYYNYCPVKLMENDVNNSNIIITTVQGLASTVIGAERKLFLEYVIDNVDLVVFDECDKVQKTLDSFFVPQEYFQKFMSDISDECGQDYKNHSELINRNQGIYLELLHKSKSVSNSLIISINEQSKKYDKIVKETFSATTLLKEMNDLKFEEKFVKELELLIRNKEKSVFFDTLALSLNVDSKEFDKKFKEIMEHFKINVLDYQDENFVKLFIRLVEFDNYIKKVEHYYELSDKKGYENSLLNFLKSRYKKQQKFLPSALIGNLFGLRLGKKGLELYRQYAFGRALMTEMPWLKVGEDGQVQGPHIMLLSGSSFAPNCLEYHINKDVNYILLSEEWKAEFLKNAVFMELGITDRVSGDYTHREENLCKVIEQSMDTIIGELSNEGKILLIVNSYNDAEITLEKINVIIKRENYNFEVAKLSKTKENNYDIGRMEISDFDSNNARVLIAPAESIARGFNIVDKDGHSSFSSVFFLTRPMQVPGDIKQMSGKLSGMIDIELKNKKYENLLDKAEDIRNKSAIYWNKLEESLTKDLSHQDEILKKDIVASVFVLILQIYGRLARVENLDKKPPSVYFADGAFRRNSKNPNGFDFLDELILYLEELEKDEETKPIFNALYKPFYVALKRGIKYERNENISNELHSEEDEM